MHKHLQDEIYFLSIYKRRQYICPKHLGPKKDVMVCNEMYRKILQKKTNVFKKLKKQTSSK